MGSNWGDKHGPEDARWGDSAIVTGGQGALDRAEIPANLKWDLARVFPDWDAWEGEFAAIEAALPSLAARRGTLARSPGDLLGAVTDMLEVRRRLGVVRVFASLRADEDTRLGDHVARDGRADNLTVRFAESVSWFEPELLAIPAAAMARFLDEEPRLRVYAHYLDDIQRLRDHTLSEPEEALLAGAVNLARGAGQVFNALNNADLTFPPIRDEEGREVELTKARFQKYIKSADRRVRREAFEKFLDTYGRVINTLAANLDANVRNHVYFARARRFDGTLASSLTANAIPLEVFHSLVRTTREQLPTIQRYTALKRRVLGVDPISEHDLYVPLFPDAEFKHGYEEAQALLLEALAPLGPEYLAIVREAFAARWIDVHENSGKRSGAYSSGAYGTPPYILLNWSDQLRDTFTLAHELGHSGHSYLAMKHQPYVYGDYPIFTAEVASTLNEALLLDFLLRRTTDRSRRLFLLDYWLTQINDTVFRQTMFAEFEHSIHVLGEEGDTLTASRLGEIYLGLAREYWGPEVAFDPERSGRTWGRIPHFYYNYYVYQYATAYAAAAVIARRILDGAPGARERYLDFLRSGSSRYPVETLALAGVDVTTPAPVQGVMKLFSTLLDEVERLLAEGDR